MAEQDGEGCLEVLLEWVQGSVGTVAMTRGHTFEDICKSFSQAWIPAPVPPASGRRQGVETCTPRPRGRSCRVAVR